jgi:hypothetical protein
MLINCLDAVETRHMCPQISFNARLERHIARGTPDAGAMEANLHLAIVRNTDQFDVPTVRLDGGPHQVDDLLDFGSKFGRFRFFVMDHHCGRQAPRCMGAS